MANKRNHSNFLLKAGIIFFSLLLLFSGFMLWKSTERYRREEEVAEAMEAFRPTVPPAVTTAPPEDIPPETAGDATEPPSTESPPTEPEPFVNQGILDAQALNADVKGWLTLPGTEIDYIFVQAENNDYYLRRDIYKKYAYAGTVFMDYRNDPEFQDFNAILFGHHLKNGAMLADLEKYWEADFFAEHPEGLLYLPHSTYRLEIFACLLIHANDKVMYNTDWSDVQVREDFLDYVADKAKQFRDIGVTTEDKLITLSTCSYVFENARTVVVARIVPY